MNFIAVQRQNNLVLSGHMKDQSQAKAMAGETKQTDSKALYDVVGIGNAIVDVISHEDEKFLIAITSSRTQWL